MGNDEDEFRVVPLFENYEVNKKGKLRSKKTKRELKRKKAGGRGKGEFYGVKYKGNWRMMRPFIFVFLEFNPYGVENIEGYLRLTNSDVEYLDGDYLNSELDNVRIKKESMYLLEREKKSIEEEYEEYLKGNWHYLKNNENKMYPKDFTKMSGIKAWWRCDRGHEYEDPIGKRLLSMGCKMCKKFDRVSLPQRVVYTLLKENFEGVELEKQIGRYRIDVYVEEINLAIEYDGGAWHREKEVLERDLKKENAIKDRLGARIIRIREKGCGKLGTKSRIFEFENRYDGNYGELLGIVCKIVKEYRTEVVKVDEGSIVSMANKIWYNSDNSIIKNFPEVGGYFSDKNQVLIEDLTYGSHFKVKWECDKCGFYWEEAVNRLCKKKRGKYCPNCERMKVKGGVWDKFKEDKNNKGVDIRLKTQKPEERVKTPTKDVKTKGRLTIKCEICGEYVNTKSKRFCGKKCYDEYQNIDIPRKEELKSMLESVPNLIDVANYYSVSDNAVRKWCDLRGLSRNSKYWNKRYEEEKGYTYKIYKEYLKLKDNEVGKYEYVLESYSKKTKTRITKYEKVVGESLYDAIGIIHGLERYTG